MTIEISSFSTLDPALVAQAFETVQELVQEQHPTLQVVGGVLSEILILPAAEHAAALQEQISRLERSNTLEGVLEDPTLADDETVDKLVSNYRITRADGARASGEVTIIVSRLATVTVASGVVFEGGGQRFQTDQAYVARTSAGNIQSATDKLLTPTSQGQYAFTVPVVAQEEGSAGLIKKDTILIPQSTITNFVRSYAASDFLGGADRESNEELVLRAQAGLSVEVLSARGHMAALLSRAFPDAQQSSIIGYGDGEMLRDQRSIFPVSFGGRVDWYVRTREQPQQLGVTVTATLVQKTTDDRGIWQFGIGREIAPGFYDVRSIAPDNDADFVGSYEIQQEVRSLDTTPVIGQLMPDVVGLVEGGFSRYQAAVIQFKDTDTSTVNLTAGESTAQYQVTIRYMPQIAEIQEYVGSRQHRNYAGDVLVRAAIPCFVSIAFLLEAKPGEPLPDTEQIKTEIAAYVNSLGFGGRLFASNIISLIHQHITGRISVSGMDMLGQILRPDGTVRTLRSREVLVIPEEHEYCVSARTVVFVLAAEDVRISAVTVNIPEI